MGGGIFRCSFNLSLNVLQDLPIYSSSSSTLPHLYLYITPLFWKRPSYSFAVTRRSHDLVSFIVDMYNMFAEDGFTGLNQSFHVRHHYMSVLFVL